MSVPDKYASNRDEFGNMLGPFTSMWEGHIEGVSTVKHRVDVETSSMCAVHSVLYRAAPKARDLKKSETNNVSAMNVIAPVWTEWASPVLFVSRRDETLRFCVYYRKLHDVTVCYLYLLPRMDEYIVSTGVLQVFSTADANSDYCWIEVRGSDKKNTFFASHHGFYLFTHM